MPANPYRPQRRPVQAVQARAVQPQAVQPQRPVRPLRPVTSTTSTLNLQPHPSVQKAAEVQDYLGYLRAELYKRAAELGEDCPYTSDQIDNITSSAEAFEKAAQEEAQCVWAGIEDTLRKEGADQDFIEGFKKEAFIGPVFRGVATGGRALGRMIGRGSRAAAGAVGNAAGRLGTAGMRGLDHAMWGSAIGGLAGGVPGMLAGGLGGLAGGTLGYGKAGLLAGGALGAGTYYGAKNMFGDAGKDTTGLAANRNRALPVASNKLTGTIGGALLGSLLANEMGMSGSSAWLMPVLGGLAGHHHLPDLMNKWKDPYGYGVNAISAPAAQMNRAMPLY